MTSSTWFVVVVPLICILIGLISWRATYRDQDRISANSLGVLAGTLAALAILIPFGATFLPNGKLGWQAWFLVGALVAATLCIFITVYSMIQLQDKATFKPNDNRHVPAAINATWITLGLLSAAIVIAKYGSATAQPSYNYTTSMAQLRFTVARDLPELGTSGPIIKQQWGMPIQENSSALLYRTKNGLTIFCLDPQGLTRAIIEAKEGDENVNTSICQPKPKT